MAMRNFYMEADIDGRSSMLTGGPAAKDGEMTVTIRQRDKGNSVVAFKIYCIETDGELVTLVHDSKDNRVARFETQR